MPETKPKDLVLILARDLADHVSSPVFLVDRDGTLVFYNEPAEAVLGVRFAEAGELSRDEWGVHWSPEDPSSGRPVPVEELPLAIAQIERRPAHRALRIVAGDGIRREIEVVAFPLFTRVDEFVGAAAVFWERPA